MPAPPVRTRRRRRELSPMMRRILYDTDKEQAVSFRPRDPGLIRGTESRKPVSTEPGCGGWCGDANAVITGCPPARARHPRGANAVITGSPLARGRLIRMD